MGCFQSTPEQPVATPKAQSSVVAADTRVVASSAPVIAPVAAAPRQKIVITEVDKAKHKLKHQRDALEQSIRKSEEVMLRDMKMARAFHDSGKTESAKVLLRRKRLIQKRIAATSAKLDAVEKSIGNIEGTEATAAVLEAIEGSTKVLNMLNESVTVERAEQVMRESEDALAYTEEVSRALGQTEDAPEIDDADVLDELEMYEKANGLSVPSTPVAVEYSPPEKVDVAKIEADALVDKEDEEDEEEDEDADADDVVAPTPPKKRVAAPA